MQLEKYGNVQRDLNFNQENLSASETLRMGLQKSQDMQVQLNLMLETGVQKNGEGNER